MLDELLLYLIVRVILDNAVDRLHSNSSVGKDWLQQCWKRLLTAVLEELVTAVLEELVTAVLEKTGYSSVGRNGYSSVGRDGYSSVGRADSVFVFPAEFQRTTATLCDLEQNCNVYSLLDRSTLSAFRSTDN